MSEKVWYEVSFIPKWVKPKDKLIISGKTFVKRHVYEKMIGK